MANHRHRTESKTSPRRLAAAERQRQALALRTGGASFAQIAVALGFKSAPGAYYAVEAALKRVPAVEAHAHRALNLERLNTMRLQYWQRVLAGDLEAMEMELKTQAREAKYLGLDAPVKQEVTGQDGEPLQAPVVQVLIQVGDSQPVSLAEFRRQALGIVDLDGEAVVPIGLPGAIATEDNRK